MAPKIQIDSSGDGISPVGHASERNLHLIKSLLEVEEGTKLGLNIGADHKNFFAESETSKNPKEPKSWFINGHGRIYPLSELSREQAHAINKRYLEITKDIEKLSQDLINSKTEDKRKRGLILKNALSIPDKASSLYAGEFGNDNTQKKMSPIIINWGYVKLKAPAEDNIRITTTGEGKTKPPPILDLPDDIPITIHEGKHRHFLNFVLLNKYPWILWLLVTLLIVIILSFLIPACGLRNFDQFNGCSLQEKIKSTGSSTKELIDNIQRYEDELLYLENQCKVPIPLEKVEIQETLEDQNSGSDTVADRLAAENADMGDLNFTMIWDDRSDLDLKVTCPKGEEISYQTKTKDINQCGTLDVDANFKKVRTDPVEHIVINRPSNGSYMVEVSVRPNVNFAGSVVDFELKIYTNAATEMLAGQTKISAPWTYTFEYGDTK